MRTEHPALEIPDLQLSRADLEAICADLLDRARAPLAQVTMLSCMYFTWKLPCYNRMLGSACSISL